jgi:hypothetical protein
MGSSRALRKFAPVTQQIAIAAARHRQAVINLLLFFIVQPPLFDHQHAYTYEMIAEYDDMINMMEVFSENVRLIKCYDEEKNGG